MENTLQKHQPHESDEYDEAEVPHLKKSHKHKRCRELSSHQMALKKLRDERGNWEWHFPLLFGPVVLKMIISKYLHSVNIQRFNKALLLPVKKKVKNYFKF